MSRKSAAPSRLAHGVCSRRGWPICSGLQRPGAKSKQISGWRGDHEDVANADSDFCGGGGDCGGVSDCSFHGIKIARGDKGPTVGSTAPDFTLNSQEGKPVSLHDFKGKWVVLYFYPKDMTTGCTIEAHNFQRDLAKYEAKDAVILGVSVQDEKSHQEFCTKESLMFKLLGRHGQESFRGV